MSAKVAIVADGGWLALRLLPSLADSQAGWVGAGGLGWLFMTSQTR